MKQLALLVFLAPALLAAQAPPAVMEISAAASPGTISPGKEATVRIEASLKPGWHVNAHVPSEDFLIPTEAKFSPPAGIEIRNIVYPAPVQKKFSFSEKPLAVYEGKFTVTAQASLTSAGAPGSVEIPGVFSFQPCNETQCLAPRNLAFSVKLERATSAAAALPVEPTLPRGNSGSSDFASAMSGRGLFSTFLFLLLGGLALNLTPCVYPIIPITIGFFGGQAQGKTGRPVGLAAVYVLGMALTYSALGVAAALSGKLFGSALQSPWVLSGIAVVMVVLSLSMFGLYDINPPRFLMNRAGAKTGFGGSFGMGLLVGVVAAPCLGPFVLGLLTFVAAKKDPLLGFGMFFVLSLGLGLPFLFLASFSGALSRLPRAGAWMVEIKKVFGFVLLGMAAYFLGYVLPEPLKTWLLPGILAVGGVYVLIGVLRSSIPALARAFVGIGGALLLAGAVHFAPTPKAPEAALAFAAYDEGRIGAAGKPAMIDFSADWCAPCHELEDITFADARVRAALNGRALFKADMTRQDSPAAQALASKFQILGMPTIVFLDANGKEIPDSRLVGFEPPDDFLKRLERLKT